MNMEVGLLRETIVQVVKSRADNTEEHADDAEGLRGDRFPHTA